MEGSEINVTNISRDSVITNIQNKSRSSVIECGFKIPYTDKVRHLDTEKSKKRPNVLVTESVKKRPNVLVDENVKKRPNETESFYHRSIKTGFFDLHR